MDDIFAIKELTKEDSVPYELLLLADPSLALIEEYLAEGNVHLAWYGDEQVGVMVLLPLSRVEMEIKNIAVATHWQNQGIGRRLLERSVQVAREKGFQKVWIGTANSSTAQLAFYQRSGFVLADVKWDFFIQHYDEVLFENGIRVQHLLMLLKEL